MSAKLFALFLIAVISCLRVDAGPAYPESNYNTWNTITPTRAATTTTSTGNKQLDNLVRQHIGELDKQTQSDLKVLGFLEKELNKIFSCYLKLSCQRLRTPKVLAECDEIKDWPLYYQVMKMAGIRKYPFQHYQEAQQRFRGTTLRPTISSNVNFIDENNDNDSEDADDVQYERDARHRPNRRILRELKHRRRHD